MKHPWNGPKPNGWLIPFRTAPQAKVRLFCLPYAGGNAMIFRPWMENLSPLIEVCPIQLPGRGARLKDPPFERVRPLVEELTLDLQPFLDKPFAFFGHSLGGLLCFELARRLQVHHGQTPRHLFVAARSAPQISRTDRPIHALPEAELIEELRHLNGTPKEILEHAELMQLLLPTLRADFALCETYGYEEGLPLSCPITAFGGLNDPEVCREELEAWAQQTTSTFRLRMVPGDHFFLHSAQRLLLEALSEELLKRAL